MGNLSPVATRWFTAATLSAVRAARVLRLLFFPARAWQLYALNRRGSFLRVDPLMFLWRKHYLSRFFGVRDRIDSTLLHYRHVLDNFDATFRKLVYHGNGLALFEDQVGDMRVTMRLVASENHRCDRCEGDVTVVVDVNGQDACYASYTFVNAASFGLPAGKTLFVTRIQLMPGRELFRQCYRNNSPQYFCLAAIAGIAKANDIDAIAAIKSEAQIAFKDKHASSFRNSYCNFWGQFGARSIDRQAYILDVPPALPPLNCVLSKHRARAVARRDHWASIMGRTEAAIRAHRIQVMGVSLAHWAWLHWSDLCGLDLLTEFTQFV